MDGLDQRIFRGTQGSVHAVSVSPPVHAECGVWMRATMRSDMHHDVLIDHACVTGAVRARGSVVVAREACCVASSIDAGRVVVAGGMKGSVRATHDVRLQAGACFTGDCAADTLIVDEGAIIEGGFFEIGRSRLRGRGPRPDAPR